MMDRYSQCLLDKDNNLSEYLTVLILLKNCFFHILNAVTHETSELILRDGVLKTTAHIELSRTITLELLWKLGSLEHLFPAQ